MPPKVFTVENTLFRLKQNNSLRCPCEPEEVYSYQEILSLDSGGEQMYHEPYVNENNT